jgi:hypothetical protein
MELPTIELDGQLEHRVGQVDAEGPLAEPDPVLLDRYGQTRGHEGAQDPRLEIAVTGVVSGQAISEQLVDDRGRRPGDFGSRATQELRRSSRTRRRRRPSSTTLASAVAATLADRSTTVLSGEVTGMRWQLLRSAVKSAPVRWLRTPAFFTRRSSSTSTSMSSGGETSKPQSRPAVRCETHTPGEREYAVAATACAHVAGAPETA